jgi:hypothetical protein
LQASISNGIELGIVCSGGDLTGGQHRPQGVSSIASLPEALDSDRGIGECDSQSHGPLTGLIR